MCIKGLTQHSSRTTGPAWNLPEPPAIPGVSADERRTIVEMMADGIDVGTDLATADLDDTVARGIVVDHSQAPSYTVIAHQDANKACVCTMLSPAQNR